MEGSGPEAAKRQRLEYNSHGSHRASPQGSIVPIAASHSYSTNTLPPPPESYAQRHPVPPSPYEAPLHEHRSLPDPTAPTGLHIYPPTASGHSTPGRERPFPSDFQRHSSGSARSPEEYPPTFNNRPLSAASPGEALHYPVTYAGENPPHPAAYPPHDGMLNGGHGGPMPGYEQAPPSRGLTQVVDHSHSPIGATPFTQNSPVYPPNHYQMFAKAKKGSRAIQACDVCRARKAKCDEGRPRCGFCLENNANCNYQEVPPAKADRANQMIMDELTAIKNELKSLRSGLNSVSAMPSSTSTDVKLSQSAPASARLPKTEAGSEKPPLALASPRHSHARDAKQLEPQTPITEKSAPVPTMEPVREPKAIQAAIEHDTAAHKLLRWPQIADLVRKHPVLAQLASNGDYVMRLEEDKGVMRVFGKGQGRDTGDGGEPGPQSPAPSNTSKGSDESTDPGSPRSPPEGLWGFGFIPPTTHEPRVLNSSGNDSDFSLNIHPRTLHRLLESYLLNLHRLHPFLDKNRLTRMVERFSSRYNTGAERSLSKKLFFTLPHNMQVDAIRDPAQLHKSGKRKHSEGTSYNAHVEMSSTAGEKSGGIIFERSASTAIVLLVMALGKICEWKAPLPGPAVSQKLWVKRPSIHESNMSSPSTHSIGTSSSPYASVPSPMSVSRHESSGRVSASDELSQPRNVDFIPGLAYYAPATDILGNLHGSNDLAHVQACLLAGLYAGQLARAFESWSWISTACRTCRFLVREPELSREREPRRDLIKFAFWTCSQLESDLLADLDLPRSGIQDLEVALPRGYIDTFVGWDDPDALMMAFYSAQIHIRNRLNEIQLNLHPSEASAKARLDKMLKIKASLDSSLKDWRKCLPPPLAWKDGDPLPTDINHARLRAKYYGAMCIVHRPFLQVALNNKLVVESASPIADGKRRRASDMPPPTATQPHLNQQLPVQEILESAEMCINSAIHSTVAFDGIINAGSRLVVTNIFGTAHAQFGNMLILSATYCDDGLGKLVESWRLEKLYDRTIGLLRDLGKSSETLAQDAKILGALREVTFAQPPPHTGSFSSMDGT